MSAPDAHSKTIHLATDHAGFAHKEAIKVWLKDEGYIVVDHGASQFAADDDFPDYISKAAAAVSAAPLTSWGIVFGGSGNGEAMMANRYLNVRAAVYYGGESTIVELSRQHNDANILSIGARFVSVSDTKQAILQWFTTPVLEEEKRVRRNQKIEFISKENRLHS